MSLTLVRDDKQNKEIQQPLCQHKILLRRSMLKVNDIGYATIIVVDKCSYKNTSWLTNDLGCIVFTALQGIY